jgi:crotonobetainyl-CoA:carnitine CoA-transferase CaiB-like acyl-CoA transferase
VKLPLAGIRIVDLSRLLPGAFATLMLAEMGSEVIKVEDPDGGDPMRRLPPLTNGRSVYDLLLNRGKKSVTLDLRTAADRQQLVELVAGADVVVESFRPRTARRLGVSADQLRQQHGRLVHCAITGYGQAGPYAERPGHDLNYVALSGLLAADRRPPGELPRMFMADVGGGAMTPVIAILGALLGRERHGDGASLDISMHDSAMYWVMLPAIRDLVEDGPVVSGELPTFGGHACYNIYTCGDGLPIALGALEPKFWIAFCRGAGRPDLAARHAQDADQAGLLAETRALFATRTREEWLRLFTGDEVCLTPVNSPVEAFADPHAAARGLVRASAGLRTVRAPFLAASVDLAPAPALGQHNAEILGRDGFTPVPLPG